MKQKQAAAQEIRGRTEKQGKKQKSLILTSVRKVNVLALLWAARILDILSSLFYDALRLPYWRL